MHLVSSLKRGSPQQEDDDDDVGEGGGEVDDLATGLDPLEETEEVDQPGDPETEKHPPRGISKFGEGTGLAEHLVVEVEFRGGLPHVRGEGEGLRDGEVGAGAGVAIAVGAREDARLPLLRLPTVPAGCVGQNLGNDENVCILQPPRPRQSRRR